MYKLKFLLYCYLELGSNKARGAKDSADLIWGGYIMAVDKPLGFCTKVWRNLITWRNKKQSVVACRSFRFIAQITYNLVDWRGWWKTCICHLFIQWCPIMAVSLLYALLVILSHMNDRTKHEWIDPSFMKEEVGLRIKLIYTCTALALKELCCCFQKAFVTCFTFLQLWNFFIV